MMGDDTIRNMRLCQMEKNLDERITCMMVHGDVEVLDNGGETADRFTVIIEEDVFGMSSNALMPNGVNLYSGEKKDMRPWLEENKHTRVQMDDVPKLPEQVKKAILRRTLDVR